MIDQVTAFLSRPLPLAITLVSLWLSIMAALWWFQGRLDREVARLRRELREIETPAAPDSLRSAQDHRVPAAGAAGQVRRPS